MKRIYNYILLATLAFMAVGCVEEEFNNDMPSAESGDEVQFGLSLGDPKTRTEYGEEANDAFPIYWIAGDKVQIFSPQCLEGRRSAEYEVTLPDNGDKAYYAKALTKTGDTGIQWGENTTANFYSLYPSGNYTLSSDGTKAEGITINYTQNVVVSEVDGKEVIKSDMEDCLMYAKKEGVARGDTVKLHYDPISTVLWLTLKVAANTDATADSFTIQSVSVEADADIAGTFSLNIADGSFGGFVTGQSSKTVLAQIANTSTGGYHTLKNGETLSIPLFLAPIEGLNVKAWKIQVVANNNTYTKTLGIDQTLLPGQIHKITLPELKPATTEWDVSKWMTYIPRNVYLSEISIPGTWNSLNTDCQSETDIAEQYKLGVRAFHLDTRWRADNSPYIGSTFITTSPTITTLSVATGGSANTYKYKDANLMKSSISPFAEYLKEITDKVQGDEYMVVFCTFAQNSYNGDICPSTWQAAISDACASNDNVYDAGGLTAETLVGDVLGKVIVVVNLDSSVSSATLPKDSKCLFTYVPMNLPSTHYDENVNHLDDLYYSTGKSVGISMYTSHAQISTTGTSSVDCGDRGYSHPLTDRDALVTSLWDWSKNNYGTTNYSHNKWIYLGLGGYIMTSANSSGSGYDTIENRYAPMICSRIDEMGSNSTPYYPLGIILMNNKKGSNYTSSDETTDLGYGFADVCNKILNLNNKYRLQYDPEKPTDYKPAVASAAASYSSGMTDQNVSAIGWE